MSGFVGHHIIHGLVDLSDDSTTVSAVPCRIWGISCTTVLSNHICPVQDDAVVVLSLPALWAAASWISLPGDFYATSLVVNPNVAATGDIVVYYSVEDAPV